jgi:hypothetical protein
MPTIRTWQPPADARWKCPFCGESQVVTDAQFHRIIRELEIKESLYQRPGVQIETRGCANPKCGEIEISLSFGPGQGLRNTSGQPVMFSLNHNEATYHLVRPQSKAKPQPNSVPKFLVDNYNEAYAILHLSPKSSATLARRVLQGMIRDFCKISKGTLAAEIYALKAQADNGSAPAGVDTETIQAMHDIRSIGNIGAHMEGDVNTIVAIDANEAEVLISLIEMLFKDWYVARAARIQTLANIAAIAQQKQKDRKPKTEDGDDK